jgi:hypothetical protein
VTIPEDQLNTWSGLGSVQQSSATYQSIKRVLDHTNAPYASKKTDSFLQGSYANDTNIYGDSDVDIVLRTRAFFHYNIDALPEPQKAEFKRVHPIPSEYNLRAFKTDAIAWLNQNYGGDLDTSGTKALRLKANGNRRSADVLLVAPHKRFVSYQSEQEQSFVEGVLFITFGGTHLINYPKQHSDNMTAKHQETNGWLKPTVRIFKNMRNRMIKDGLIKEGGAPSYFIEGMLHNVPKEHFGGSYQKTVEACWGWINGADHGSLYCANWQHYLIRDNVPTSWPVQGFIDWLDRTKKLWLQWSA